MAEGRSTDHGDQPDWVLVDALNVIGSRPTGWWRDRPGAIRSLVSRLRKYAERRHAAVTVVIDGRPLPDLPEGPYGPLEVSYARRPGRNAADDRIVELLAERGGHAAVTTADRNLRERVEAMGVRTIGPRQLLQELDGPDDS
jgi:predicted RNA-binding protein with PIN domain